MCTCCGNGNDSGCCQTGGYSTGSYTGGYSTSGYTGSYSSGCSTGSYSTSGYTGSYSGDDSGDSSTSTPFLYINDNGIFRMENDVMFGKPTSRFASLDEGLMAHSKGLVVPDLYLIDSTLTPEENGQVRLQLKEIEPEVSAVHSVELRRLVVSDGQVPLVKADFSGCVRFTEKALGKTDQINVFCKTADGRDVTDLISWGAKGRKGEGYLEMKTSDLLYVDCSFEKVNPTEGEPYLVLESWYRDWTMGTVYQDMGAAGFVASPWSKVLTTAGYFSTRGAIAGLFAFVLGYIGFGTVVSRFDGTKMANFYAGSEKYALADTPSCTSSYRSLNVSYKNRSGSYTQLDVIEPRYAKANAVAIRIPPEAINGGKAELSILATKKHRVSGIAVAAGEEIAPTEYESFTLERAHHHRENKDYTKTLAEKESTYMRTHPSDVITMTFKSDKAKATALGTTNTYLFGISGVYAPASKEDQAMVPNWTNTLDGEALKFLSEVYKESGYKTTS